MKQKRLEGTPASALRSEGKLTHPGFDEEDVPPVTLSPEEFVAFSELGGVRPRGLEARKRRLTLYQHLRHGPLWQLLGAVAVWALSTTWVAYERWKRIAA